MMDKLTVLKQSGASALMLGLFSVVGIGLVVMVFGATADKIAQNERDAMLRSLKQLVAEDLYDNDIVNDKLEVTDLNPENKKPAAIYRARKNGQPVSAVLTTIAPDGYNGNIKLLVAVNVSGELAGVRVVSHHETPGLGDEIEPEKSDWILGFANISFESLAEEKWAVKRDGGEFDQFTGATITPRAVVKAVKKALRYFHQHKATIFAAKGDEHA